MKPTLSYLAPRIVALTFLVVVSRLNADTVYSDNFNRIGALVGSQPSNTTSGNAWTGFGVVTNDSVVQTNGTVAVFPSSVSASDGRPFTDGSSDDKEPSLAFTPPTNSVVTLSAIFSVTSGSGPFAGWLGLGFINDNAPNPGIFSTSCLMMTLSSDGSVFAGSTSSLRDAYTGNPGAGSSNVNLKIVYDSTDAANITAAFFVNGSELGGYSYGSSSPTYDHVFLRSYLLGGGYVDDFKLTVGDEHQGHSVPDDSNTICLLVFSLGGLFALHRKYFKRE